MSDSLLNLPGEASVTTSFFVTNQHPSNSNACHAVTHQKTSENGPKNGRLAMSVADTDTGY